MINHKNFVLLLILILSLFNLAVAQESQSDRAYQYAEKLYKDGLYDVATEQYQQYLTEYPRGSYRPQAALHLGEAYFELGKYDAARKAFQQVDLDYPGTDQAQQALWKVGEAYEQMGEWTQAAKAFQRLFIYYPESHDAAEGLLRGATDAQKARDYDLASALLQLVIENFYTSEAAVSARIALGKNYRAEKKYQMAWNELDKALNASPTKEQRGQILLEQARTAEHLYSKDRAIELYGKVVDDYKRQPIAERAALEQGRLALLQQNYPLAADLLDKAAQSDNNQLKLHALELRGDLAWYQKEYTNAAQYYTQALANNPSDAVKPGLQVKKGLALEKSEDYSAAYEQLQSVDYPEKADSVHAVKLVVFRHLANVSVQLQRYHEAIGSLQKLIRITKRESQPALYEQIGDISREHLQDYPSAIRAYQTVIDSFPKSEVVDNVLFSLGKVYFAQDEYQKALGSYSQLVEKYPFTEHYSEAEQEIWTLRNFYGKDTQVSFRHLAQLFGELLLNQDSDGLYFRLGKLYFEDQQDYEAAIKQFQRLLQKSNSQGLEDTIRFYLARSYATLATNARYNGDTDKAESYGKNAITLFDSLAQNSALSAEIKQEAHLRTATLQTQLFPEQGVQSLTTLIKQYPNDLSITLEYAKALKSAGQESFALTVLEPALKQAENQPEREPMLSLAASLAYNQKQRGMASDYYSQYLEAFPFGPAGAQARWVLMDYALADTNYSDAAQYGESLRQEAFYTSYRSLLNDKIGQIYIQARQFQKASNWYADQSNASIPENDLFAGRNRTDNAESLFWAGYAFEHLDQPDTATTYYQAYIFNGNNQAHLAESHRALGDFAASRGDYTQARSHYQQAVSLAGATDLDVIPIQKSAAKMAMELGEFNTAATEYLSATKEARGQQKKDLWQEGIIAQIRAGQSRQADGQIKEFTNAFNLRRNDLALKRFEYEKAKQLAAQKNFRQARSKLESILDDDLPADFAAQIKYELGREYVVSNDYEKAVNLLTQITVDYPKSDVLPQVYVTLGTVYYEQEQPQLAIGAFRNALDNASSGQYRQAAMQNLIKLYENNGLYDAATGIARDYVEQYPNAENVFSTRIQIGTYLIRMHEYDRAIDYLKSLLREADVSSASEIQFWIAESYFNQNQYEKAIAEYLKIPYMNPPTKLDWAASALWKAGNAYERLGKSEKAIQLYERIIREKGSSSNFGRFARRRIDELNAGTSGS